MHKSREKVYVNFVRALFSTKISESQSSLIRSSKHIFFKMNSEFTHPRWEAIWAKGLQPGQLFDALAPSPCLLKYLDGGVVNLLSRTNSQRLFFTF